MPQRKYRRDFDFKIHEDQDHQTDNESEIQDFAKFSVAGDTLVNGDFDEYDSAEEEEEEQEEEGHDSQEDDYNDHDEEDDFAKPFTTETLMTTDTLVDDDTDDSILDEFEKKKGSATNADSGYSRRTSGMSSSTHSSVEHSDSHRDSTNTYSYSAYDEGTEDSESRRESTATYDSADRVEGAEDYDNDYATTEGTHSRRGSYSDRRGSARTDALIRDAARNIVNKVKTDRGRDSLNAESLAEEHHTSYEKPSVEDIISNPDEGGENSSHHENEDDIFSDNSPRSSVGSISEAEHRKMPSMSHGSAQRGYSPRVSGISAYSRLDDREEDFVPTIRGTPRPAFRSPSSVKAMQMSSPPASAHGTPRSSRRTPLPTVSRLGSPSLSAQYSPKKTPPRFKRSTPPLVLLHATLLPLRWPWGDVLDAATTEELSQDGKNLRDAWRQLQDRMGDTTCERGILLPHPQNDFEILEERLLEALELPLRRRARILECGHYLGPSNEPNFSEDEASEDGYSGDEARQSTEDKTHWCGMCRSEIKYDSLGEGKIFRVKVYASNGLMRAGAWEACWKEMERVDIELEPILEAGVQEELDRLATEQQKEMEREMKYEEEEYSQEDTSDEQNPGRSPTNQASSSHPHKQSSSEAIQRGDSLPRLLFHGLKATVSDKKNLVIAVMSVLVLVLALKTVQDSDRDVVIIGSGPTVTVPGWTAQTVESFTKIHVTDDDDDDFYHGDIGSEKHGGDDLLDSAGGMSETDTPKTFEVLSQDQHGESNLTDTDLEGFNPTDTESGEDEAIEATGTQSTDSESLNGEEAAVECEVESDDRLSFNSDTFDRLRSKPCTAHVEGEYTESRTIVSERVVEERIVERILTVTVTEKVFTPQSTEVEELGQLMEAKLVADTEYILCNNQKIMGPDAVCAEGPVLETTASTVDKLAGEAGIYDEDNLCDKDLDLDDDDDDCNHGTVDELTNLLLELDS